MIFKFKNKPFNSYRISLENSPHDPADLWLISSFHSPLIGHVEDWLHWSKTHEARKGPRDTCHEFHTIGGNRFLGPDINPF